MDDLEPRIASLRTIAGVSKAEADSWHDAFSDSAGDFDLGMPSPAVNEDSPEDRIPIVHPLAGGRGLRPEPRLPPPMFARDEHREGGPHTDVICQTQR
ncbi:hypothetical protein [Microbacterium deminutum]